MEHEDKASTLSSSPMSAASESTEDHLESCVDSRCTQANIHGLRVYQTLISKCALVWDKMMDGMGLWEICKTIDDGQPSNPDDVSSTEAGLQCVLEELSSAPYFEWTPADNEWVEKNFNFGPWQDLELAATDDDETTRQELNKRQQELLHNITQSPDYKKYLWFCRLKAEIKETQNALFEMMEKHPEHKDVLQKIITAIRELWIGGGEVFGLKYLHQKTTEMFEAGNQLVASFGAELPFRLGEAFEAS
ncbi:hypothetical protein IWZ01DRAFT_539807 [Phyllosticta capitalensis]